MGVTFRRDNRLIRIRGFAVKGELCYVTALFVCSHFQIKEPLKFILDTGSTHTVLAESTAKKLGIDLDKLPQKVKISGIAGTSEGLQLSGIQLIFTTVNGKEVKESLPFVRILKNPPPRNMEEVKAFELIPNLLGLDIIRRFTLRFENQFIFLEREV